MNKSMSSITSSVAVVVAAAVLSTALTGAVSLGAGPPVDSAPRATCYTTARDATYNRPGCTDAQHWVQRRATGSTRHYGGWAHKGGTSAVTSYVDWTRSGTKTR